jgi:hypothetical protein
MQEIVAMVMERIIISFKRRIVFRNQIKAFLDYES